MAYKEPEQARRAKAAWHLRNKESVRARHRRSYVERRATHLAWEARRRAERKGVPFSLAHDAVVKLQAVIDAGKCEITGTTFDLENDRGWNSPSLDQISAGLGYVPGNVRVVCRAMNFAMGNWGEAPVWEMFQNWSAKQSRQKAA